MVEKNKQNTAQRLINAVSLIIEEQGFGKLGVNQIARMAECDKVLIYRYFGGLDGLLAAWAKENDYYTSVYDSLREQIGRVEKSEVRSIIKRVLLSQITFLRENKLMQEMLLWELTGHDKFKVLQDLREKNGNLLQQTLNKIIGIESEDINQSISILIAAIDFIVLYTRQYSMFNGIDFSKEGAWKQFEHTIDHYIDFILLQYKTK